MSLNINVYNAFLTRRFAPRLFSQLDKAKVAVGNLAEQRQVVAAERRALVKLREDIEEQSDDPNIGILAALTSKVADTEAHLMTLTEKLTTEEAKVSAAKEEAAKITAETEKVRHATMEEVAEMKAQAAKVYEASVEKAEESRNESNKLLHDAKEEIIKAEEEAEEIRAEAQKVRGCGITSCIHIESFILTRRFAPRLRSALARFSRGG